MEYLTEIIWYASWPVVMYISLKFVEFTIARHRSVEE